MFFQQWSRMHRRRFPIVAAFLPLCFAAAFLAMHPAKGSDPKGERVETILREWHKPDAPGLAWAVVFDGKVIGQGAFGVADLEHRVPITSATRFNIGSMSKQFTALAVLQLAKEKKLALDDDVHRFVPELPSFGQKITLDQLIHHTSGLQDWDQIIHLAGIRLDDAITHAQVLKLICGRKELNFLPGAEFGYTNSGYSLLATVVERTTREAFARWMRAHVFQPLGLGEMYVQDRETAAMADRAESYVAAGTGTFRHIPDKTAILGASSIYCSMDEFVKYLRAFDDPARAAGLNDLTNKGRFNGGATNSYACGIYVGEHKGLTALSHEGGWAGFHTFMLRIPEKKLGVALFSNHGSLEPGSLVSQIADVYLGVDSIQPPRAARQEIAVDAETLDRYVGDYALSPSLIISITRDGDHLLSEATGHAREMMFAESKETFFFKVENSTITFVVDEKGLSSHLVVNRQGRTMEARRIVFPALSSEALGDYAGDYVSDELGSRFTVRAKGGGLCVVHARHGEIGLTATAPDHFTGDEWWLGQVIFQRNAENRVVAFAVPGSRIQPVRFTRVAR
jgi:CubicO group peptidase (beta-lactamase class C family)